MAKEKELGGKTTMEFALESPTSSELINDSEALRSDIPPGKSNTDLENDIWDIKSLNFDMEPVSKPSQALENYMKNCEENQKREIQQVCTDVSTLNTEIEKGIRAAYEIMKCELKGIEGIIENWETYISSGEIPLTDVMMKKHKILNLSALGHLLYKRKKVILEFHNDVMALERARKSKATKILKDYFKSSRKLSLKRPGEIRELMEFEILKINQIVMSNIRNYEDLKLNLYLHGEGLETSFRDFLEKCQRNFILKIMEALKKEVEDTDLEKYFSTSPEGKLGMKSLFDARDDINSIIKQQGGHLKFTAEDLESWTKKIQRAAENLDECAKEVIAIYKKVTYSVFQGNISHLEKMQDEFLHLNPEKKKQERDQEMEDLQKRIFTPLLEKQTKHSQYISEMEIKWTEIMKEMQKTLRSTFFFLRDSSKIWDRHFQRTNEAKNMTNMKMMTTVAEQTITDLQLEKDLNIVIDNLRQEPNEYQLKVLLRTVYGMLDGIAAVYISNSGERNKVLEKYLSTTESEIKILLAEIDKFLDLYPNEFFNDYFDCQPNVKQANMYIDGNGKDNKMNGENVSLPVELQKCQYQTDALRNWKLGLREAIVFYSSVCPKEVLVNTKRWMEKQKVSMKRSLDAKLAIHHARYHRVKTEVYGVRLSEIWNHHQRLQSHIAAAHKIFEECAERLAEFSKKASDDMEEFRAYVEDMDQKTSEAENSVEASKLAVEAHQVIKKVNYMFENSCESFQKDLSKTLDCVQSSNENYLKSLKLFPEGGTYHPDEVAAFCRELDLLINEGDKQMRDLQIQSKEKQSELLHTIKPESNRMLQRIKSNYEDLQFAEKISQAVQRVRDFIKKEVKHMKYNRKLVCLKMESLLNNMPAAGTNILTSMDDDWSALMKMIEQHCEYLLQPGSGVVSKPAMDTLERPENLGQDKKKSMAGQRDKSTSPFQKLYKGVGGQHSFSRRNKDASFSNKKDASLMSSKEKQRLSKKEKREEKEKNKDKDKSTSPGEDPKDAPKAALRFKGFDMDKVKFKGDPKLEHRALLFYSMKPPIGGMTFMENVCRCMWEVLLTLEQAALVFYKTKNSSPLVRRGTVKDTFKKCMQEIVMRFKYYHLQCEDVWLSEVNAFHALTERMKSICNIYMEQAVRQVHENRMNAAREAHKIFLQKIENMRISNEDSREQLSEKLKPLHGYPGNKHLLDQLLQEVKKAGTAICEASNQHIKQYKAYLKERKIIYKDDMRVITEEIQAIVETVFEPYMLLNLLMEQADEVIEGKKKKSVKKTKRARTPKGKNSVDESAKPTVPQEYRLSIDPLSETWDGPKDERTSRDSPSSPDPCLLGLQARTTIVTEPMNTESQAHDFAKEFNKYVKYCIQDSADRTAICEKDVENWVNTFLKNVKEVEDLYKNFVYPLVT